MFIYVYAAITDKLSLFTRSGLRLNNIRLHTVALRYIYALIYAKIRSCVRGIR